MVLEEPVVVDSVVVGVGVVVEVVVVVVVVVVAVVVVVFGARIREKLGFLQLAKIGDSTTLTGSGSVDISSKRSIQ